MPRILVPVLSLCTSYLSKASRPLRFHISFSVWTFNFKYYSNFKNLLVKQFLSGRISKSSHSLDTAHFSTATTADNILKSHFHPHEENNNALEYFHQNPAYRNTLFTGSFKNGEKHHPCVEELINASTDIVRNVHSVVSDENQPLVQRIMKNIKELQDHDLFAILYHIPIFAICSSPHDPKFKTLWLSLDKECVSRMSSWNINEQLQVADLWSRLQLTRFSKFHWNLINKCFFKCERLSKEQFIRFMFCLNLVRQMPKGYGTYEIEQYLTKQGALDRLDYYEVAIIAMALFKTESIIRNVDALEGLLKIAIANAGDMDSISVSAVAKLARLSSTVKCKESLISLQEVFLKEIDRLSISACTHLALIGTKSQLHYMPLINKVVKKIEKNIKNARLKELERISMTMTMFSADCHSLGEAIVDELRSPEREQEIRLYGRCIPAILHYLTMKSIFPHDLIDMILKKSFQDTYYSNGRNAEIFQRELLCVDFCAELEIDDYSGARLNEATRDQLLKINFERSRPNSQQRMTEFELQFKKAAHIVGNHLGTDCFYVGSILPQHNSQEIVFCINPIRQEVVKIPNSFSIKRKHEIKFIPTSGTHLLQYHVLYICRRSAYIESENSLAGATMLQIRQLQRMGYVVHVLTPSMINEQDIGRILSNRFVFSFEDPSCAQKLLP